MLDHGVPERSITAFEQLHHLTVTVHDPAGLLWPVLDPARLSHRQAPCRAVKALGHESACQRHDGSTLQSTLAAHHRDGRVHVCHAGFVEWVVPGLHRQGLDFLVFAGLRRAGPRLQGRVPVAPRTTGIPGALAQPLALVEAEEADLLLEALSQLAARLSRWCDDHRGEEAPKPPARRVAQAFPTITEPLARRRLLVRYFLDQNYQRDIGLADLARHLGLSPSRAGHAVAESCGDGFVALLRQTRLRAAGSLLRHTDLAISDVALRSGFNDIAHFHRCFRQRFGTTPHAYRRQAEWSAPQAASGG